MGYSINNMQKIVHNDGNVARVIAKVIYCDNYGNPHQVWPAHVILSNLYVVRLNGHTIADDHVSEQYRNDANGEPTVTLLPGYDYTVKGDINVYNDNNVLIDTLHNCYFFGETISGGGDSHMIVGKSYTVYGVRTATHDNGDPVVGASNSYLTWACDEEPGEDHGLFIQAGFYEEHGYVQLGFLFDPNYNTQLRLKRATIYQTIAFATNSTNNPNNIQLFNSGTTMQVGSSVTIYPKFHKTATSRGWTTSGDVNYESYCGVKEVDSNISLSYNNSYFNVVDNNNGSYTITVIGSNTSGQSASSITFTDSVSNTSGTINIVPLSEKVYEVWRNGASCIGANINLTTGNNDVITFMECSNYLDANPTWVEYSGSNCNLSSDTSGVVTISQQQTYPARFTINAIAEGTRYLTPTIEGQTLSDLTVNVSAPSSVSFTLPNGTTSTLNSTYPYPASWNFTTGQVSDYIITFSSNVYAASGDPTVGNGKIYVSSNGSSITLSVMSTNQPSSGSTYNVDVYTSQGGTFLGTITVTLNH